MNVTWVKGYPSGHEKGNFLALDMGGTNLRVCEVDLSGGQGEFEITQKEYRIPDELKTGTADQLWDFIAEEVRSFVHQRLNAGQTSSKIPLAFTFSYPVHQPCIDRGVLQRWTKDFDVAGVEGSDVVIQLEAALERKVGELCTFPCGEPLVAYIFHPESTRESCRAGQRHNGHSHRIIIQRP